MLPGENAGVERFGVEYLGEASERLESHPDYKDRGEVAMEGYVGRPIKISGMVYAPTNEQGVVFLFGRLAPELGFDVEQVQSGFPDCTTRRHGKFCRIGFEFRASIHEGHPARGADTVVCWDNDWKKLPQKYQHLEVIALRDFVGS